MKFKAISAFILLAMSQAVCNAAPAVASTSENIDPTGLVGKTITPPALPAGSDTSRISYGNDYYNCGGSMLPGEGHRLGISSIRKGIKTTCKNGAGRKTLALTEGGGNGDAIKFWDVIEVTVPKGYLIADADCQGAKMVVTKYTETRMFTRHLQAWEVVNKKFVPVTNLKAVKCENPSFGV